MLRPQQLKPIHASPHPPPPQFPQALLGKVPTRPTGGFELFLVRHVTSCLTKARLISFRRKSSINNSKYELQEPN